MPGATGYNLHQPERRSLADGPGIEIAFGFNDRKNQVFAHLVTVGIRFDMGPIFAGPDMQVIFHHGDVDIMNCDCFRAALGSAGVQPGLDKVIRESFRPPGPANILALMVFYLTKHERRCPEFHGFSGVKVDRPGIMRR